MSWLHFIGKKYYSQNAFLKEAMALGVSRVVALSVLKVMNWGDRVLLAQHDGKSSIAFAYFRITRIQGEDLDEIIFTDEVKKALKKESYVLRGCGSYEITVQAEIDSTKLSLPDIANRLETLKGKKTIMIGGSIQPLPRPIRLKDIKFQRGFRKFDFDQFYESYQEALKERKIYLKGQFWPDPFEVKTEIIAIGENEIIEGISIKNYKRKR